MKRDRQEPARRTINLDDAWQTFWVTEAQYTGGSLYRISYGNKEDYESAFAFLRDKASIDSVRGYRVVVKTEWEMINAWRKED